LRATFFGSAAFIFAAAWAARLIREPDARATRELIRSLPVHLRRPESLDARE
jgi:hypothetical protein